MGPKTAHLRGYINRGRLKTLTPATIHMHEQYRTADFHLHYTDALQKFRNRASSGNLVIYNCSNPGLCSRKFLFLLPHIPTLAYVVPMPI